MFFHSIELEIYIFRFGKHSNFVFKTGCLTETTAIGTPMLTARFLHHFIFDGLQFYSLLFAFDKYVFCERAQIKINVNTMMTVGAGALSIQKLR